jgi:hypothetical protein
MFQHSSWGNPYIFASWCSGLWHCGLIGRYQCFRETYCLHFQPRTWRQYVSQKCWYLPMSLHGITTQKNNNCHENLKSHIFASPFPHCEGCGEAFFWAMFWSLANGFGYCLLILKCPVTKGLSLLATTRSCLVQGAVNMEGLTGVQYCFTSIAWHMLKQVSFWF